MDSNVQKNVILYDWLSFTTKNHTPEELIGSLGLSHLPWVESRGSRGYRSKKFFGSISVHYDGREDMGVWCEMSGQGCRSFESLSKLFEFGDGWSKLFCWIHDCGCKVTRLDVAYDDHTGILPLDKIIDDTLCGMWISKSNFWECVQSSEGRSVFFGSPKSKVRLRIYDKAAERHAGNQHWIRCEIQLRDSRAQSFIGLTVPIGKAFLGVLLNYLRFVVPNEDSNKWRWPMTEYWSFFRGGCRENQHFSICWA